MRELIIVMFLSLPLAVLGDDSVIHSLHNLSRSGPGQIKSSTEIEVCKFCHIPHTADPVEALWGHQLSTAQYEIYTSDTLDSTMDQPNGSSKLCLSCHDGTIALGGLINQNLDVGPMPFSSGGFIGTDLSGSHPVSMVVDNGVVASNNSRYKSLNNLSDMTADSDGVALDGNMRFQCTSCHDPHSDLNYGSSGIHFWRKSTFSEACLVCHTP
ncbi:MAG TPA: cytochrome c3 family protein [Thermoanaerobaculia bacterium]|nr:cytochrome c3 family protein [Thermoanaerobaculia bacterium]HUM29124.1 cytochrome c3 family protein [Thermoanaerobaculia bacterium]HXK67501.1 cytochrome c3 family protein [Thermoanaerobaculia bacterium]